MDKLDEIVIRINLTISSVEHPELAHYLNSEPHRLRRTRNLCQLATIGLLSKDTILAVPHIISQRTSSAKLAANSPNGTMLKTVKKVNKVSKILANNNILSPSNNFFNAIPDQFDIN